MQNKLLLKFKEKLFDGKPVYGPFMKTSDPAFVEVAGYAGFDFVILDTEHGPVSYENLQNLIRAAQISGILPIVRVAGSREEYIARALDIGAAGIQVPQVTSPEEAARVIKAAKFYPEGERGVCRFVRAANYSAAEKKQYFNQANETLVILQLEGLKALENIDDIMNIDGIDILFIGPYDLSQSVGLPGEVSHPEVVNRMKFMVNKAKEKNIIMGTFTDTAESINMWKKAGIKYLSYSVDVGIFMEACKNLLKAFKD